MASSGSIGNAGSISASSKDESESPLWKYVTRRDKLIGGGTIMFTCNFCNETKHGSYTRVRAHLLNIPGKGIATCKKVRLEDKIEMEKLEREHMQRLEDALPKDVPLPHSCGSNSGMDMAFLKRRRGSSDNPISKAFNNEARATLDAIIARMFYTGGLSFNLARNPFFIEAFIFATSNPLVGYNAPGYNRLRTSLLQNEKANIGRLLEPIKKTWREKGVSIVSDGWSDVQRRPLINFIAICDAGPMFLKSIDTSGEVKDRHFISGLLKEVIDEVGPQNVVQVITDNASNCKAAGEIIERIYPHIYWTPCVVHTLNLALKNICAAKNVENNIETYEECHWITEIHGDALQIKNFILNHSMRKAMFDKFSSLKLLSVADTRFAHVIITLKRMRLIKCSLQAMVICGDWLAYKADNIGKAKFVKEKLLDDSWWESVDYILEFAQPIYNMIRECDTDKPSLHLVYEMWDTMIDEVKVVIYKHECKGLGEVSSFFQVVYAILTARWTKSNTPLHCLAYSLNPRYYYETWLEAKQGRMAPSRDDAICIERSKCFKRLFPNQEDRSKVNLEYANFALRHGPFGEFDSLYDREAIDPKAWWGVHGSSAPLLQDIALKILGQVSSSSCSERNWSTYGFIHSLQRNRLLPTRAEDLVFVHNNHRLLSRRLPEYKNPKSKMWDISGDDFGTFEDIGLLDIASLSLDEPELEAVIFDERSRDGNEVDGTNEEEEI